MMTYDEARTTIQRYTVYRHFKGGLYHVDVIAKCAGTGKPIVIYHDMKKHGITWARPAEEWYEEMDTGQKRFEEVKIVPAMKGEREGECRECQNSRTVNGKKTTGC